VQVRHQHQPDLGRIVVLLLQGHQRGRTTVQENVGVARSAEQDARLEPAAGAEGVTGADELYLHRASGHTWTLHRADQPGDDLGEASAPTTLTTRWPLDARHRGANATTTISAGIRNPLSHYGVLSQHQARHLCHLPAFVEGDLP
jgi:hypothetical protein